MQKNECIKETKEFFYPKKETVYQNQIPFSLAKLQYKRSLFMLKIFLEDHPFIFCETILKENEKERNEKSKKENISPTDYTNYILKNNKETWGISIYEDKDAYLIEIDEYIKEENLHLKLRTMFIAPKNLNQISLLGSSYQIIDDLRNATILEESIPKEMKKIPWEATRKQDNQSLVQSLKTYHR